MFKIMLIDDEAVFRTRLKELIDWRGQGLELVAEAATGNQALTMIAAKQPDIIIVDMNMPGMSGAELIEIAHSQWPQIKAIGLSGYDDYDYLRQSMKSGAVDYLLKHNLDELVLLAALESASSTIDQERSEKKVIMNLENKLEEHLDSLQESFIASLLKNDPKQQLGREEEISKQLDYLNIQLPLAGGALAIMIIDRYWLFKKQTETTTAAKILKSFDNIVKDIISEYDGTELYSLKEGHYIIFSPLGKGGSYMKLLDQQKLVTSRIRSSICRYLNLSLSFCLSEPFFDLQGLLASYRQTMALIDERFYGGCNSIKLVGSNSFKASQEVISLDVKIEKQLSLILDNADQEAVVSLLNKYFDQLHQERVSNKSFKIICLELVHLLGRKVRELEINESLVYDPIEAYEGINRFDTLADLRGWIIEKYIEFIKFVELFRLKDAENPLIHKAVSFIHKHYQEPISLRETAEFLGVSAPYLSKIFKDQMGKGFTEYLSLVRIDRASSEIATGRLSLKEIASNSGFQSYTYFFKVFKQITGMTPNEYEQTTKGKESKLAKD